MEVFVNYKEKRSWVEIDLNQIKRNYLIYKNLLPSDTEIIIVTKADAYGHGDVRVAWKLIQEGVKFFAVSNIDEAVALRDSGVESEILILGYTSPKHIKTLINYDLTQAIVSKEYLESLLFTGQKVKCHFAIDTGMNRIGLNSENVEECVSLINKAYESLSLTGLFTHLCVADNINPEDVEFTKKQIRRFKTIVENVRNLNLPYIHCYNSAAGFKYAHCEDNSSLNKLVRLGIVLYGLQPSEEVALPEGIKPAITWKTVISLVKEVAPGETIGYGRTYKAEKPMRIATIPTGYADGYRRGLSNRGKVIIAGKYANIVGKVCMDQFMVDVTDIPEAVMGSEVILLGKSYDKEYTADDMAKDLDTIGYEILCGISKRVQRYYK